MLFTGSTFLQLGIHVGCMDAHVHVLDLEQGVYCATILAHDNSLESLCTIWLSIMFSRIHLGSLAVIPRQGNMNNQESHFQFRQALLV